MNSHRIYAQNLTHAAQVLMDELRVGQGQMSSEAVTRKLETIALLTHSAARWNDEADGIPQK